MQRVAWESTAYIVPVPHFISPIIIFEGGMRLIIVLYVGSFDIIPIMLSIWHYFNK